MISNGSRKPGRFGRRRPSSLMQCNPNELIIWSTVAVIRYLKKMSSCSIFPTQDDSPRPGLVGRVPCFFGEVHILSLQLNQLCKEAKGLRVVYLVFNMLCYEWCKRIQCVVISLTECTRFPLTERASLPNEYELHEISRLWAKPSVVLRWSLKHVKKKQTCVL